MTVKSPIEIIEGNPSRRSRSESITRYLLGSSYPHACYTNLALAVGGSVMDGECREELAEILRASEKDFTIGTFVRCIEITRDATGLSIEPKALDLESVTYKVHDIPANHVSVVKLNLPLQPEDILSPSDRVLQEVLRDTIRVISPELKRNAPLTKVQWDCYYPAVATANTESGFNSLVVEHRRKRVSCAEVIAHLRKVLAGNAFKIYLTPKGIVSKVAGNTTTFKRPTLGQ